MKPASENLPTVRVAKLGGSLLDVPDLTARLREWLGRQAAARTVLVVGGGRLADALRDADRLHQLGEKVSHWLCIRAMTIHAEMLAAMLPEVRLCRSLTDWRSSAPDLAVLDPWRFLRAEEGEAPGAVVPETWQATSDSIAARAAVCLGAAELVLLKSSLLHCGSTLPEAAAAGYVDALLPEFGGSLPSIRCVNLRATGFPEVCWRPTPSA